MRDAKQTSDVVISYLTEIMGGNCSITTEQIEKEFHRDQAFAEILMGLSHLHEDLIFRRQEQLAAEDKLKSALRREEQKNIELGKAIEVSKAADRAKSDFLATMSHEIRTPMNAVLSCSKLLLDNVHQPENIKLLKTIHTAGETLLAIINDILDFSKIESKKLEIEKSPFDLHGTINEVVELLSPRASSAGVVIDCEVEDSTPNWIYGDVVRIRQVLMNLVGNALKFTRDRVQIRIHSREHKEGMYRTQFSVVDNGIGMTQETMSKLFVHFHQGDVSTTRRYGGTGLGLAICKGIVETMGGEIWAESDEGQGSTFFFTVLAQRAEAAHAEKHGSTKLNPNMGKEHPLRILVAEDNSVNQMIVTKILEKLGYDADIVNNGVEAVQAVRDQPYDVVFMDQHMPEMDGVVATQAIRKFADEGLKIIALTASAFQEDRDRCLQAGMDDFMTKPINFREVTEILLKCSSLRKQAA